jgi:hypothetical protein
LTLDINEIDELVSQMDKESKALRSELIKMTWFMRGGINIEQIYMMDPQEREIVVSLIKENLETTEKTKLPFF